MIMYNVGSEQFGVTIADLIYMFITLIMLVICFMRIK